MKIVIPGGSGQVGNILARSFVAEGHDVVILGRSTNEILPHGRYVSWDAKTLGSWVAEFETADVVINLAGKSVNCRFHKKNRDEILASRLDSTRIIGQAIAAAKHPPKVWLQASTATIYDDRYDAANDEATGIIGKDEEAMPDTWRFSMNVAKAWEAAAHETPTPQTRKILPRSALILSPGRGGILDVLLGLVRKGLGGTNGSGKQFVSWIHETDFVSAVKWLIDHEELCGPVNLSSPNPLPNKEFMSVLRQASGVRIGFPATRLMLEVGAIFMRTETELVLKSRRVIPKRLLDSGFEFAYPRWPEAAKELCDRWKCSEAG
jgi:uncharacterized protein (TIGR01777 family)